MHTGKQVQALQNPEPCAWWRGGMTCETARKCRSPGCIWTVQYAFLRSNFASVVCIGSVRNACASLDSCIWFPAIPVSNHGRSRRDDRAVCR